MTPEFFKNNRKRLIDQTKGGVIVLSAHTAMQRRGDSAYFFEQESNFWWLTGIDSADWQMIIDGNRNRTWLVAPIISESRQVFEGSLSWDEAQRRSGVEAVVSGDDAEKLLRDLAAKHSVVYGLGGDPHAKYYDFFCNPAPKILWQRLERIFNTVRDCRHDVASLRAIKQPDEIAMMKRAIGVTAQAFEHVEPLMDTFQYEYEIEAEFSYYFKKNGARGHAYDPIVATGSNACTLHYVANDAKLKKGQLVLLDIGAHYGGYAADITRTYAKGAPTARQQAVHAAVQRAHHDIIELLSPHLGIESYQEAVRRRMTDALLELGLMCDSQDVAAYQRYFPHAISHGLGIDVHDSLGAPQFFAEGMVLTVEPGIYIPEEGIGVRIEDDILITADGHANLSQRLSTAW